MLAPKTEQLTSPLSHIYLACFPSLRLFDSGYKKAINRGKRELKTTREARTVSARLGRPTYAKKYLIAWEIDCE